MCVSVGEAQCLHWRRSKFELKPFKAGHKVAENGKQKVLGFHCLWLEMQNPEVWWQRSKSSVQTPPVQFSIQFLPISTRTLSPASPAVHSPFLLQRDSGDKTDVSRVSTCQVKRYFHFNRRWAEKDYGSFKQKPQCRQRKVGRSTLPILCERAGRDWLNRLLKMY